MSGAVGIDLVFIASQLEGPREERIAQLEARIRQVPDDFIYFARKTMERIPLYKRVLSAIGLYSNASLAYEATSNVVQSSQTPE